MNGLNYIGADELIFNTDNEAGVYSGGFNVNSIMLKAGLSPIMTLNHDNQTGGANVSDLFDSLVIPNWAVSYGNRMVGGEYKHNKKEESDEESDGDVDDDLHDKLLALVRDKENEEKLNSNKLNDNKTNTNNKNNIKKPTRKQKIAIKKGGSTKKNRNPMKKI